MSQIVDQMKAFGFARCGASYLVNIRHIRAIEGIFNLVAFLFYILGVYNYVAAVFTGIDSTWNIQFFLTIIAMAASLAVNITAIFLTPMIIAKLQKSAVSVTAVFLGILLMGTYIANENATVINAALKTDPYKVVTEEEGDANSTYYPSSFNNLADLIQAGKEKCEEAVAEGAVLLKNENGTLPLSEEERRVSFFGVGSVDPIYSGTGSGGMDSSEAPTFKSAFERNELFAVNDTLWNWYSADEQKQYLREEGSTGAGVTGIKKIGEAPWSVVASANDSSFANFGDAAIVVISRLGGEGSDLPRGTLSLNQLNDKTGTAGDSTEGDYLKLSPNEISLLKGLKEKKDQGVFKKVILLMNYANQIEAEFLNDPEYGIDAALWISMPGKTGLYAVADILAGEVNPSGNLSTTFWKTHDQNPSMANFGTYLYEGATVETGSITNLGHYYVVYQEGIYVGYKYTETRYEDYVVGRQNVGNFNYANTVTYPFGYGLSYSSFEYSNFKVMKTGSGYKIKYVVEVDVTNNGPYAGKEVVQAYLQKAYGNYNVQNKVEASSVELVGFAKTETLAVGETEKVTIEIDGRQFSSYDANNEKTYVITEGDYYLTIANDAHDAVNNILAKKNYTPVNTENRMDAEGNKTLVSDAITLSFDSTTYATSVTGATITNQFEYTDWNNYEHKGNDTVEYVSRNNWVQTLPSDLSDNVILHWSRQLETDINAMGQEGEVTLPEDNGAYPIYGEFVADKNGNPNIKLINMRADEYGNPIDYNDDKWDTFLNQLTWEETVELIRNGIRNTGAIVSIDKPGTLDHNGPSGLTQPYNANKQGLASQTKDKLRTKSAMFYPSSGLLAASFNIDLMYEIGDLIGEDALWAGYSGLYGPGSNIERTPYSGRNFEYYSEDGYLSGMICAYECAGMENNGLYVYNKHIGLNDQEDMRRGICTWANEQSIREIYMRAFELPITIRGTEYQFQGETVTFRGASGVMTAFNRMGIYWSATRKGMMTSFLREECGMTGIAVTDMWASHGVTPYMNLPAMLVAGTNLVDGMQPAADLNICRENHADVAWAMREAAHRILYTVVHSNAMNGYSTGTRLVPIMPWWQTTLLIADIVLGVAFMASLSWCGYSVIRYLRKNKSKVF